MAAVYDVHTCGMPAIEARNLLEYAKALEGKVDLQAMQQNVSDDGHADVPEWACDVLPAWLHYTAEFLKESPDLFEAYGTPEAFLADIELKRFVAFYKSSGPLGFLSSVTDVKLPSGGSFSPETQFQKTKLGDPRDAIVWGIGGASGQKRNTAAESLWLNWSKATKIAQDVELELEVRSKKARGAEVLRATLQWKLDMPTADGRTVAEALGLDAPEQLVAFWASGKVDSTEFLSGVATTTSKQAWYDIKKANPGHPSLNEVNRRIRPAVDRVEWVRGRGWLLLIGEHETYAELLKAHGDAHGADPYGRLVDRGANTLFFELSAQDALYACRIEGLPLEEAATGPWLPAPCAGLNKLGLGHMLRIKRAAWRRAA